MTCPCIRPLLDHLVGGNEQLVRYGQPERLRGLEIDDQREFRLLLDRQICQLLAPEKAAAVDDHQAERVCKIASSSLFAANSPMKVLAPVRLPPGRARLATRPSLNVACHVTLRLGVIHAMQT